LNFQNALDAAKAKISSLNFDGYYDEMLDHFEGVDFYLKNWLWVIGYKSSTTINPYKVYMAGDWLTNWSYDSKAENLAHELKHCLEFKKWGINYFNYLLKDRPYKLEVEKWTSFEKVRYDIRCGFIHQENLLKLKDPTHPQTINNPVWRMANKVVSHSTKNPADFDSVFLAYLAEALNEWKKYQDFKHGKV